jgi:uncharacterized glyoxalase superfamily protein PhnB
MPHSDGQQRLAPRIVTEDVPGLVTFLKTVFLAWGELERDPRLPTRLHIGSSRLMVSQVGQFRAMPAFLGVTVTDFEATYARAVEAGARTLEGPFWTPFGHRRAFIEDRWGNIWVIQNG